MSDAVSPTELLNSGEDVNDIVTESADYVPYELLEPTHGDVKYISKTRETKVSRKNIRTGKRQGEPFLSIELVTTELEDPSGETITLGRPIRTWVNTIQFSQRNRPGTTSSVSSYLLEAGFSPKDLSGSDLVEALGEAANIPLEAIVGWTNRGVKNEETGEWSEEFAVTKDFNRGTKEEPNYVAEYEDDDRGTVKAKHRIVAFRRV
jgi:hypothetical protein